MRTSVDKLSAFSKTLLETLDRARRPLSTEEVIIRTEANGAHGSVRGRVRPYLQHALSQYVTYLLEDDAWILKPKYEDTFTDPVTESTKTNRRPQVDSRNGATERESTSGPTGSDGGPDMPSSRSREAEDNKSGEKETGENDEIDAISRAIIGLLGKSGGGLKAADIADLISFSGSDATKTDINRRLYGELGDRVIQVDNYQWILIDTSADGVSSEADAEGTNIAGDGDESEDVDDQKVDASGDQSQSAESDGRSSEARSIPGGDLGARIRSLLASSSMRSAKGAPSGNKATVASEQDSLKPSEASSEASREKPASLQVRTKPSDGASLVRQFDLASSIARVLNLFEPPLLSRQIERLLAVMGTTATQEAIEECLSTILKPYVEQKGDGWTILRDQTDLREHVHDETQKDEEDSVTRAHVASLNYNYVFDEVEIDGALLFSSDVCGGDVQIYINQSHPAYSSLEPHIDNNREGYSAVELLMIAWVEMESDLKARRQDLAEHFRDDWGRALRRITKQTASDS
jgi:hypothetical protein